MRAKMGMSMKYWPLNKSASIEAPDTGRHKKVVQGNYSQQTGGATYGQLDADQIGQDADKENADQGNSPVHYIYAHNPPLMDIIGICQQKRVAQCQPAGLPQTHDDKKS